MNDVVLEIIVAVTCFAITGILGFVAAQFRGMLKKINGLVTTVNALVEVSKVSRDNIVVLRKIQRPIIRALRSHSYAFREMGVNGSVNRALEHIGTAEDELNACADENTSEAMSVGEG